MIKIAALIVVVCASGCDSSPDAHIRDRCLRTELFESCLLLSGQALSGLDNTSKTNWEYVIDECEDAAYYQSVRKRKYVKPECQ